MYTATANVVLPTTIIGSLPRPGWYTQNLGGRDFREAMVDRTLAELGRVDILVNNVGGMAGVPTNPVLKMSDAQWDRVVSQNVRAPYLCCTAVARRWIERGQGGSIVSITSIAALAAHENIVPYGVAKAGLVNLTKELCAEWGPYGIRVNAVAPGAIVPGAHADRAR